MARLARDFQIFAKPAGAICNLDCHYCYYLEKRDLYPDTSVFRMSEDLLERYIVQHLEAAPGPEVHFSWHGGEPTLLGVDYYRRVVEFQRKHRPAGWTIRNGMQTNGVLLDEEWAKFLAGESFNVGISLDGPAELHDPYRVNRGGQATHRQVMRGYDLLRQHGLQPDILCVVHTMNVGHPLDVYRFFRDIGGRFIVFLPVVVPEPLSPRGVSPHTPKAEDYGTFLCRIFDEWIQRDADRIMVQIFDEAARPALGLDHSLCIYRETCGQIPVLEHNGDLYSCDHFVTPAYRLGNINQTPLVQLLESPAQHAFGDAKRDTLPRYCRECEVLAQCHGECPKYRFIQTPDGEPGLNYLCAGLKKFFLHSREPLKRLAARQRPAGPAFRAAPVRAPGRNEPCPCGSGRKYKKCCGAATEGVK